DPLLVDEEETALIEDAAHSLRLALEREEAGLAHQEAAALRRSRELQRGFLSMLSHELRTPLTAIRGYASSLMQPDVTWDGDPALPPVWADHDRLEQVSVNLLNNAFRHNPPGTLVRVTATSALAPAEVEITVADDGPGFPAEFAAAPFESARRDCSRSSGAG